MGWLSGLALLPVLLCAAMMGGMGLMAALGLRRSQAGAQSPPPVDRVEVRQ